MRLAERKRVVLVDDHISIRQMLAWLLRDEPYVSVAGQAATGLQALEVCASEKPHMVILDLVLPELSGAELVRRLRVKCPQMRILLYSGSYDRRWIGEALDARPHGLVHKSDPLDHLREAVRIVSGGGRYFTPFASELQAAQVGGQAAPLLSAREREVLQMVAESRSSKEIAARLRISTKTVENHRHHLMTKLGLHDVAALTRHAIRHGLVDVN